MNKLKNIKNFYSISFQKFNEKISANEEFFLFYEIDFRDK